MKKRFSEEQIIGFLREVEAGMPIKDLCKHGFSEASYYRSLKFILGIKFQQFHATPLKLCFGIYDQSFVERDLSHRMKSLVPECSANFAPH